MSIVPSIRPVAVAAPPAPEPVTVEAALSLDDWTDALLHVYRETLARQRRRYLIFLAIVWFLTLLGVVSNVMTDAGPHDVVSVLRAFVDPSFLPVGVFLGVTTLGFLALYAALPWRARRATRRTIADDVTEPIAIRYRLDDQGITVDEAHRTALVPWSWIVRLDETQRHLLPTTDTIDEPIVLPKRALTDGAARRVRDWIAAKAGMSGPDAVLPESGDALRLRYDVTIEDRAAVIIRQQEMPRARRHRLRGFVIVFVLFSLILPVLFAFGWIVDPQRVPFEIALPLYVDMFAELFWKPALAFAAFLALLMLVHKPIRMASARGHAAQLHQRARQGEILVTIGEDGIRTAMGASRAHFGWGAFRRTEYTKDHIILPLSRGTVLPLPRRVLHGEALTRFEALARRHLSDHGEATT